MEIVHSQNLAPSMIYIKSQKVSYYMIQWDKYKAKPVMLVNKQTIDVGLKKGINVIVIIQT